MALLIIFIVACVLVSLLMRDHAIKPKNKHLVEDAKIVDFRQVGRGRKLTTRIETYVYFDDGYVYVSCKSYDFIVGLCTTKSLNNEIIEEAMEAHTRDFYKQETRIHGEQYVAEYKKMRFKQNSKYCKNCGKNQLLDGPYCRECGYKIIS